MIQSEAENLTITTFHVFKKAEESTGLTMTSGAEAQVTEQVLSTHQVPSTKNILK